MKRAERVLETPAGPDHEAPPFARGRVMADDQPTVAYREIPEHSGYRAGDDGSIWSCWECVANSGHRNGTRRVVGATWNRLKESADSGYVRVNLKGAGKVLVHRLVLSAFAGECPEGMIARHIDGNRLNNRADNLTWGVKKRKCSECPVEFTPRNSRQVTCGKECRRGRERERELKRKKEHRNDPAYREREREREREHRNDPAYRERELKRMREYRKDPAYRERQRKWEKERMEDPVYRELVLKRMRERERIARAEKLRLEFTAQFQDLKQEASTCLP